MGKIKKNGLLRSLIVLATLLFGIIILTSCVDPNKGTSNVPNGDGETNNPQIRSYTLTYNGADGGRIVGVARQNVDENQDGTEVIAVANNGFQFIGWSDGKQTAERKDTNVTQNISVTAQFEIVQITYVTATFCYNDGRPDKTITVASGSRIMLEKPERLGYTFLRWSGINNISSDGSVVIKNDLWLTASWEVNTFNITYNLNGGTLQNVSSTFTVEDLPFNFPIPTPLDGKSFVNWTTDEQGENKVEKIDKTEANLKDCEVFAIYENSENLLEYQYVAAENGYRVIGFTGNGKTRTVSIPATHKGVAVTSIGSSAFSHCSGLTSITIPDSVTSIGSSAFSSCSGLTSVTIPDSVRSIGDDAFSSCSGLTSITIPDSVTSIGSSAFSYCSGLTSITIPDSVTSIEWAAFSHCSGLRSVTIPDSVTSIGSMAFSRCSGLTSITIPNSVTSIGGHAFSGCSGLTSVTILEGVTSINAGTFAYCSSLTNVAIPRSVTKILSCNEIGGVTYMGGAFQGCTSLTSIMVSESVTSIEYDAFNGCSGLESITIPDSVMGIGSGTFRGCSKLSTVYVESAKVVNDTATQHYLFDYADNVYIRDDIEVTNSLFTVVFELQSETISLDGKTYKHYKIR